MPVPAPVDDVPPSGPEPVTREDQRAGPGPVLDLPRLLGGPAGTAQAEGDLGMVAEMHHAVGIVDGPAAPARRRRPVGVLDGG